MRADILQGKRMLSGDCTSDQQGRGQGIERESSLSSMLKHPTHQTYLPTVFSLKLQGVCRALTLT